MFNSQPIFIISARQFTLILFIIKKRKAICETTSSFKKLKIHKLFIIKLNYQRIIIISDFKNNLNEDKDFEK